MSEYKKQISDREVQIIQLLEDLALFPCTLIKKIENNVLVETCGNHISRMQWDILKVNNDIIAPLRKFQSKKFSPGFYCHMNSLTKIDESDYRLYLLQEIKENIGRAVDKGKKYDEKYIIYREVEKTIRWLIDKKVEINQFYLLHGDLYNGNILYYQGKYAMIDFEYVRFGPSQLEWAFLLFWDLIVESNTEKRENFMKKVRDDIITLKMHGVIDDMDIKMILELYLPCIVCLSMNSCDMGLFEACEEISYGLRKFWNSEYKIFKEDNYA